MDWKLESENLKLENMIIVYQEHIETLEKENDNLRKEIHFLHQQLEYKALGNPIEEDGCK